MSTRGRFLWFELLTNDTDAAKKFYTNVVGWDVAEWPNPDLPPYTMWMSGDRPSGGVYELPAEAAAAGSRPHWLAYIGCDDADATVERATELGAKILMPAMTVPEIGRFAILKDPHGAEFAVLQPERDSEEPSDRRIGDFTWNEICCLDIDAAAGFYHALFGWERMGEMEGPDGTYAFFGKGGKMYGGLYKKTDLMPSTGWLHYVWVDNADKAYRRATDAGAATIVPPMEIPGGDRIAMLIDPQGAAFAVHSSAPA